MTRNRVYWSRLGRDAGQFEYHAATPAGEAGEIYPLAVADARGRVLLVWQVGPMAVGKTATVKWAICGNDGKATGEQGTLGVSTSGTKAAAFVGTDGQFRIITTARP